MSTELLLCPYCGNDELDTTTTQPLAMNLHDDDSVRCGMEGCPIENVIMFVRQWNRRFVCLDKNGDKVFAGGEVNMQWPGSPVYRCKVTTTTIRGVLFEWLDGDDCWDSDDAGEIELIKEAP